MCVLSFFLALASWSQKEEELEQGELVGSRCGLGRTPGQPQHGRGPNHCQPAGPMTANHSCFQPVQMSVKGPSWLPSPQLYTSLAKALSYRGCAAERERPGPVLSRGWAGTRAVTGTHTTWPESFNSASLPCFESKQACVCSSQAESRFLTAVGLIDVSVQLRGLNLLVPDHRAGVPSHVAQTIHPPRSALSWGYRS